jgi:hypothetical protein
MFKDKKSEIKNLSKGYKGVLIAWEYDEDII